MGLLFVFVLFLMMIGLFKVFKVEGMKIISNCDVLVGYLFVCIVFVCDYSNWVYCFSWVISFSGLK